MPNPLKNDRREKLIEDLNKLKDDDGNALFIWEHISEKLADFILAREAKIVEPLVKLNAQRYHGAFQMSEHYPPMYKAVQETLKNANVTD